MKRSIKSLLLVLALALLVGGYWVVTNMTTSVNVTQSSVSTAIVDKNAAISSISWTYEGEDITLNNNDGTWFLANDETYPINQNAVKTLMGSFTGVMAKQKIDGVSSLADYGLEEPAYTVTFTADGEERTFSTGDATPLDNGYYFYDGSDVYVTGASLKEVFESSLLDLTAMEEIPAVSTATHIVISGPDASFDQTYYEENASLSYNANWHWFETGTKIPTLTDYIQELLDAIGKLTWNTYVAHAPSEEDLNSVYGMNAENMTTIAIYDGADEPYFEMHIGRGSDNGYYAMLAGSDDIYTLANSDSVLPIVNAQNADVRSAAILSLLWQDLTELTFDAGTPLTMVRTETEAEGETVVTVTVNGEAVDPDAAKEAFEALTYIVGYSFVDGTEVTEPILTITANTVSEEFPTVTIRVGKYNATHYVAVTDAQPAMLLKASEVDELIRTFSYIPAAETAE